MKSVINMLGILLIVFGIFVLGYQGITYTKREKVAEIGNVQVTADKEKTIYFHPLAGGAALVIGVILVMIGRRNP